MESVNHAVVPDNEQGGRHRSNPIFHHPFAHKFLQRSLIIAYAKTGSNRFSRSFGPFLQVLGPFFQVLDPFFSSWRLFFQPFHAFSPIFSPIFLTYEYHTGKMSLFTELHIWNKTGKIRRHREQKIICFPYHSIRTHFRAKGGKLWENILAPTASAEKPMWI